MISRHVKAPGFKVARKFGTSLLVCINDRVSFLFQAEDGIRGLYVTGVQTCALPISAGRVEPAVAGIGRRPRNLTEIGAAGEQSGEDGRGERDTHAERIRSNPPAGSAGVERFAAGGSILAA